MRFNDSILKIWFFLFAIVFLVSSCKKEKEQAHEEFKYGNAVTMGDGVVKTFVQLDENNVPVAIGIKISAAALENLPEEADFDLEFPTGIDVAPFNHIVLDYSSQGHEPPGVYDAPHFDLHFFYVSKAFRDGIMENDSIEFALAPDLKYIPETFAQVPGGEAGQGAHWINTESSEWNGGTFTETFIYGTYDGEITFVEPMVNLDYLKTKSNVTYSLKQPVEYPFTGYHPMSYTIEYDAETNEYIIALSDMIMRQ